MTLRPTITEAKANFKTCDMDKMFAESGKGCYQGKTKIISLTILSTQKSSRGCGHKRSHHPPEKVKLKRADSVASG